MLDDQGNLIGGLATLHARIAPRFARAEPRRRALAYLTGLLSPLARKTGWQLAMHAGDLTPDGMQRFLNTAAWDADAVRDDVRDYVVEQLGAPGAVLFIAETGFRKKGHKSVGTARQYNAATGRIENCQVGVFLAYSAPEACALLDRELYLPEAWARQPERRRDGGIPPEVEFATKPQLARAMLARALAAAVPAAWVTGDDAFGGDPELRAWLEAHQRPYLLAVAGTEAVRLGHGESPEPAWAADVGARLRPGEWRWLQGDRDDPATRRFEWARVPLAPSGAAQGDRWLVLRRGIGEPGQPACYLAYGPSESSLEAMAQVAGQRWAIDDCLALGRREVGLDQYEVRHWRGWYRHVTLAMLAQAYLTAMRLQATRRQRDPEGR